MKFNELNKSNQLIAYMHCNGISVKPSDDYDQIMEFGITTSLHALQAMLSVLKAKGFVYNTSDGYWFLTESGKVKGCDILATLDANEVVPNPDEDEDEQPSDFQNNAEATNWTDVAQKFAGIAQQFANAANGNIDSLQKAKSLEIENDKLKTTLANLQTTIANLRRQLNTVYAELDAKNMKIEHLEDSIDKLANNFVEMHNWALQMKNGGN